MHLLKILGAVFLGLGLFVGVMAPAAHAAGPELDQPRPLVEVPDQASSDEVTYELRATYQTTGTLCTNGLDAQGDPCLELNTTQFMGSIFSWANLIIPVLIPLAAIGIGLMFGSQIVAGLKSFFSGFRIMG